MSVSTGRGIVIRGEAFSNNVDSYFGHPLKRQASLEVAADVAVKLNLRIYPPI